MSTFSTLALFSAGLATMASAAVTAGTAPTGPAIYQPGLASVVPVGVEFSVTWDDTTRSDCGDVVDLILLHGPDSTTLQPIGNIATKTNNNGSFAWTPSSALAPSASGYGIELVCSKSQAIQYTTPFGISNDHYVAPSSSSSSSASASASTSASVTVAPGSGAVSPKNASATVPVYTTEVVTSFTTYCPLATSFAINNKTYTVSQATTLTITDCPCTITRAANATVAPVTGYGGNSTVVQPTGNVTVPATLQTTATPKTTSSSQTTKASSSISAPSATASTGSAAHFGASFAGFVVAAGVAVFAL